MKNLLALTGLILFMITSTPVAGAEVSAAEFREMQQTLELALARIKELEQRHVTDAGEQVQSTNPQPEKAAVPGADNFAASEPAPGQVSRQAPGQVPGQVSRQVSRQVSGQISGQIPGQVSGQVFGQVTANTARLDNMSWAERIRLNGDFLYRYQYDEGKGFLSETNAAESEPSRNRQRIRAHLAVIADLSKDIVLGFGFSTGGDSPVSAVQTLGGAGSSKDLKLDLAYFDWAFKQRFNLSMGKFRNHFQRPGGSGLFWDSDWRPEGLDFRYGDGLFYVNTLGTWLESDSNKSSSNFSYGLQGGLQSELGNTRFNIGAGYWDIKSGGENCFDAPSATGGNGVGRGCFGNTATDGQGNLVAGETPAIYVMDYVPVELYASLDFDAPLPWSVFADFAKNTGAKAVPGGPSEGKKLDTAYAIGAALGSSKQAGDWQVKLTYQDIEADSVLGLLTDSNFGGGGTDSKGFKLVGKYMLTDRASFGFTYYRTERQDSNGVENGSLATSNPFDFNTLQVNVLFKAK